MRQEPLTSDHIEGCLALSQEAGWNQNKSDWRFILSVGEGFGLWDDNGRLVATTMTLAQGDRFSWICMVLVAASRRRQGLATRLMRSAMDLLRERRLLAGLDATPTGREVYRLLGFSDVYPLTRMQAERSKYVSVPSTGPCVKSLRSGSLGEVASYDVSAFGADRLPLLENLYHRQPGIAHVALRDDRIVGYVLGREGRLATEIGPLVADDGTTATALANAALTACSGPIFLDVPDHHQGFMEWLRRCGFEEQRRFFRMLHGRSTPLDDPERIFLIAGPELG